MTEEKGKRLLLTMDDNRTLSTTLLKNTLCH